MTNASSIGCSTGSITTIGRTATAMVRIRRASATRVGSSGRPRSTSWTVRSRLCAERGESKPIELTAPDGKPAGTVYAYQSEPDEWRIYDKYGGRSLGGEPGETIKDALRHIGYQLEES